jgi:hypothetical protein
MEEYHGIAIRFCWTRKPSLKMAPICRSDRNVLQSCAKPGGSRFGGLALSHTHSLRAECQFLEEDGKNRAKYDVGDNKYPDHAPGSHPYTHKYCYVEWAQ